MTKFKIYIFIFLALFARQGWTADALNCSTPPVLTISASGTYTIQRDAPVGTAITPWYSADSWVYSSCTGRSGYWLSVAIASLIAPLSNQASVDGITYVVYPTNISGVGYVIKSRGKVSYSNMSWDSGWYGYVAAPSSTSWATPIAFSLNNIGYYTGLGAAVRFVKYSDTASGLIQGKSIAKGTAGVSGTWGNGSNVINLSSTLTINTVQCAITTPNLVFPIGDIPASAFGSSVGTTPSSAQNTQNLGLNCDAGANINVSLQGTQNPDVSTTSVLALSGQGNADVAKGVGIQLLYNGAPLVLNNRIVLKQSAGGQETFPITARYYQTKTAVTTGKANASATLDLTYQ
ncbi:fimbrial protein [Enterobacter bugandensis]|nr:fimbrial protein [Enterobacter bugandensis]